MATKAFAYLRVSGRGQIEGDGFTRQLEAIRRYAAQNDIRLVKVFREEGVSGAKDLENRPALMEMMEALLCNGVKLVLVEKLDRLARDLMVQESIIRDFTNRGLSLVSVSEPDLCSEDPTRKLMRQILGAFAEYEKAMIVLKLRGARNRAKVREGRCEGRKPYGFYEAEKPVLGRMVALRSEGWAFDRIAAQLNAEGVPTRTAGKRWFGAAVARILNAQKQPTKGGR